MFDDAEEWELNALAQDNEADDTYEQERAPCAALSPRDSAFIASVAFAKAWSDRGDEQSKDALAVLVSWQLRRLGLSGGAR